MGQDLDYSIVRRSAVVHLRDETGRRTYTLRELDGHGRDAHFARLKDVRETRPDGKIIITSMLRLQASLVAASLYDDQGKLVPEETIAKWPARVLEKLAAQCDEINVLDEAAVQVLGNGSGASGVSGSPSPPS